MPARKPTSIKVLQGTARPDRMNPNEPRPQPLDANATPPTWLSPEGRHIWRRLAAVLGGDGQGVATVTDADALALLADAYAELAEARRTVQRAGATYETKATSGATMTRAHPAVAQAADAWRRVNLMLQQFGLTPAARGKVDSLPATELDPLEELLGRHASR